MRLPEFRLLLIAVFSVAAPSAADAATASLVEQRAAFREAYAEAERGSWERAENLAEQLAEYPLWPDLRAAYLRAALAAGDDEGILEFVEAYPALRVARDLRYRLALRLGQDQRFPEFLTLYDRHYRDLQETRLDCLALQAAIASGDLASAQSRGADFWLSGHSQPEECDPVFAALRRTGILGPPLYRQRYALAVEAREFGLARYLARSVDEALLAEANRWLRAHGVPAAFIDEADSTIDEPSYRDQLSYATIRLAMSDPDEAALRLERLEDQFEFDKAQRGVMRREIALWSARLGRPAARDRLGTLPPDSVDAEVLRWRARDALRAGDWPAVLDAIGQLDESDRIYDGWRYWKSIALRKLGQDSESRALLEDLSRTRGYYGFLAADELEIEYRYGHAPMPADEAVIERLAADPALVRARELYHVGLEGLGRSEWDRALGRLGDEDQRQAAILADRWGWHSRAIATAARVDGLDDLVLRYPLPYREEFSEGSAAEGIAESWIYGVARSESLFMRDIRSGAGAIGLMQLMPETGRRAARDLQHPYAGWDTLVDPQANIRLGSHYLGNMFQRFSANPVLATAAYNAGPLRVEQWLPQQGAIDARIWVETIPYDATRSYVRRVLESATIFHWRLTGETRRISTRFDVAVVPAPPALASEP